MRVPGTTRRWLVLAATIAVVHVIYWFYVSAGTFRGWPTYTVNYDLLAEGFRSGHLYIPLLPNPELLSKADPFDYANRPLWYWDMSLYKGHYYIYWGPLPAVVLALVKMVFRIRETVGDQYLCFGCYSIYIVSGSLLIDRMARRLFHPAVPLYLVVFAIFVLTLANPNLYCIATAGVYQTAIVGGQAFLLTGMVFAFDSLWNSTAGRPALWRLLATGTCWALAISCRLSLAPPVLALTLLTVFFCWRGSGRPWPTMLRTSLVVGSPVAMMIGALLTYNKARFDSWFEFGLRLQVSTMPFRTARSYVAANVYSYLLRPIMHSCSFPYLRAPWDLGADAFPSDFPVQPGYWVTEPVAGILLAVPFCWIVPLGIGIWIVLGLRGLGLPGTPHGLSNLHVWCLTTFAVAGTTTMVAVSGLFLATMRYMLDALAGVVIFSTWSAWCLYSWSHRWPWFRRLTVVAILGLGARTIAVGMLLGVEGYDGQLRNKNPALYERITNALPHCNK